MTRLRQRPRRTTAPFEAPGAIANISYLFCFDRAHEFIGEVILCYGCARLGLVGEYHLRCTRTALTHRIIRDVVGTNYG